MRFGPNSLSFNSNTALKEIYGFRANVRKAEFYDAFVHPAPNTHNTRDKALHARKRRVLSQAFSDAAIKQMERYVLANVRTFCQQIGAGAADDRKGWSLPKNMSDWCNYLSMDILGDLCFGKAFHMLERPDNRYALELVSLATTRHLIVSLFPSSLVQYSFCWLLHTRWAASTTWLTDCPSLSAAPCPWSESSTSTRSSSARSPPAAPST